MSAVDFNTQVINEFRENGGRVGGPFDGAPLLLLHHRGAKSGTERVTPLVYLADGERHLIFASKGGAPENPAWFHNLKAHPDTTIEVGTETIAVTATELTGEERDRLYERQASLMPNFREYQEQTSRKIPVVALTPR
ncbi:nitroreductase family deazaflavin-dependent oxidoreductase [Conexibacter sp. S30A1]|uniref:nitroreductase family deazaflavin-dependent oxidoreductase n=1 Tax=Conexibacter sp. S30A1 TaxID=2937800 RepID=UPI00200F3885|nr:nitroreductase family deazaflavin-dependent oxidoreductase [Conexibacter sp. S30A1]